MNRPVRAPGLDRPQGSTNPAFGWLLMVMLGVVCGTAGALLVVVVLR